MGALFDGQTDEVKKKIAEFIEGGPVKDADVKHYADLSDKETTRILARLGEATAQGGEVAPSVGEAPAEDVKIVEVEEKPAAKTETTKAEHAHETVDDSGLRVRIIPPKVKWEEEVPNPKDADIANYHDRNNYVKTLDEFYAAGVVPMLIGEAGSGKSTLAKYFALQKKLPFLLISADGLMGIRELYGAYQLQGATSFYALGTFVAFTQRPSVILIDEVTALDPAKNFAFHQMLAERKFFVKDAGHKYSINKGCMIMFAGNPTGGRYAGVNKMNMAFADRMATLIIEPMSKADLSKIFTKEFVADGRIKKEQLASVLEYVEKTRKYIRDRKLKAELSFRSIQRILTFMSLGASSRRAVDMGFLNTYLAFEPVSYAALSSHTDLYVTDTPRKDF